VELLLPTAFHASFQGDPRSEARTNADGVIGHIRIGVEAKADLELEYYVTQFTVVEAKVGSPLSKGTINAKYFDCDSDKSCKRNLVIWVACLKDKYLCKNSWTQIADVFTPLRQTIASPTVIRIKSTYKVVCFGVKLWFDAVFNCGTSTIVRGVSGEAKNGGK
jgi:hypothetical protein